MIKISSLNKHSFLFFQQGNNIATGDYLLYWDGYIKMVDQLLFATEAAFQVQTKLASSNPIEVFSHLNGAYHYCYQTQDTIYFGIDHFGGNALFYSIDPQSKLLQIYTNPIQHPTSQYWQDESLLTMLFAGYTLSNHTIWSHIKECAPGVIYSWNMLTGIVTTDEFYRFFPEPNNPDNSSQRDELFHSLFPKETGLSYQLALSGGLDSRMLLCLLLKSHSSVQAFSYGSSENTDLQYARDLCEHFHTRFKDLSVHPLHQQYRIDDYAIKKLISTDSFGRSIPQELDWGASQYFTDSGATIVLGHSGDWLAGSHLSAALLSLRQRKDLIIYLQLKHLHLCPISNKTLLFQLYDLIADSLENYPSTLSLPSIAEAWNLEHRQHKYIVNACHQYLYSGNQVYLPFFDRDLMEYYRCLQTNDRLYQQSWKLEAKELLFVGQYAAMTSIPSTRSLVYSAPKTSIKLMLRSIVRRNDIAKKYFRNRQIYSNHLQNIATLFNQTTPTIYTKLGDWIPSLQDSVDILKSKHCPVTAKTIQQLLSCQLSQFEPNGLIALQLLFRPEGLLALEQHY